jgi:hypothetical protein
MTRIFMLIFAVIVAALGFTATVTPAGAIASHSAAAVTHPVAPEPLPVGARDPSARVLACNANCYQIQEKNGGQYRMGFNSDNPGYFLKSKGAFDGRDFILAGIPDKCSLGSSCFEARMVTVQNLEVVASTCTVNAGQTFELESGTGHTGDVYKFYVSGGDNFIRSRSCDRDVGFQDTLDANLEFGQGLFYRVLYFAGT